MRKVDISLQGNVTKNIRYLDELWLADPHVGFADDNMLRYLVCFQDIDLERNTISRFIPQIRAA